MNNKTNRFLVIASVVCGFQLKTNILNNKFLQTKIKGNKMLNKNLIVVIILGLLFTFVSTINAQEKPIETKEMKMMMQDKDMQNCMDKIAADSTMRMKMMNMMMKHAKSDTTNMMQMCKTMMDNPEMHKTMMKMMNDKGMMKDGMMKHEMKSDSTKKKSNHESHH